MARRLALILILALLPAASAWAHGPPDRKRAIDARIDALRGRIAEANRREGVLTTQISAVASRIRVLEADVASATSRLAALESELAAYEARLAKLTELYRLQTRQLHLLRGQYRIAERRLNERLVAIYQTEEASTVAVVLSAASFDDLLDGLDYVEEIGRQDRRIAEQVDATKRRVTLARARTRRTRKRVHEATEAIRVRTAQQRAVRDRLVASRAALADARSEKQDTLASVQASERDFLHEVEGLERASAALAAAIQAAQRARAAAQARAAAAAAESAPTAGGGLSATASSVGSVSSSGFIWPVSGPVTSGFGWRWGRMHAGIDISAATGTPIRAAAAGAVIYAGWMSGYGNLVVIDHGGSLATAYAHMSALGAGVGQQVVQGQVIGYVGCTGNCYGSHLHFEVRVGAAAVDPLGYL